MNEKLQGLKHEVEGTVLEFFLGKNVIAKIAIFLLFLGVMSFGQLAYVDWLNDSGRMIMIGTIGVIVSFIGNYFERCNSMVFSTVFYVLGVFTLFLTNMLGYNTYWLYSFNTMLIVNIVIMISTFLFFSYRRSEFLDGALLLLYTIIMIQPAQYFDISVTGWDISIFYATLLMYSTIIVLYWLRYYKDHVYMQMVMFVIIGYAISYYYIVTDYRDVRIHMTLFLQISYIVMFLGMLFLGTMQLLKSKLPVVQILTSLAFLFFVTRIVIATTQLLDYYYDALHMNFSPHVFPITVGSLFFLVLPIQLVSSSNQNKYSSRIYLVYMIIVGLILSIQPAYRTPYTDEIINAFPLILSALMMGLYFWKEKRSYQIASMIFVGFSISTLLFRYTLRDLTPRYQYIDMFLPTFVLTMTLLLLPLLVKRKIQHDAITISSLLLSLAATIPLVFMFTYEWHLYDNTIIYAWIFVVLLIGFRYLIALPLFHTKYTKGFIMAILGKIVFVIFITNFWYFDHQLNQLDDVLFLLFTLLMNGYVALAMYEMYHLRLVLNDYEYQFIVYFIVGAIVQSIWIHRYVNVEFDKVILSSYFMIASAIGILIGFRHGWQLSRKIGLGVIYFSLVKFFIYDFFTQDFSTVVRMITYFILGFTLLGISFLYSYLEKTYGAEIATPSEETYKTPLL